MEDGPINFHQILKDSKSGQNNKMKRCSASIRNQGISGPKYRINFQAELTTA